MLRFILCSRWNGLVWSTFVEINFVFSLACDYLFSTHVQMNFVSWLACNGFVQNKLNTFELLGQHDLICILRARWYERGLVNTYCVIVYIQTHVEMHYVSTLAWEGFCQSMLTCITGMGLF